MFGIKEFFLYLEDWNYQKMIKLGSMRPTIKNILGNNYNEFNEMFQIDTKIFEKEIASLNEMVKDGIVTISDESIKITELVKI